MAIKRWLFANDVEEKKESKVPEPAAAPIAIAPVEKKTVPPVPEPVPLAIVPQPAPLAFAFAPSLDEGKNAEGYVVIEEAQIPIIPPRAPLAFFAPADNKVAKEAKEKASVNQVRKDVPIKNNTPENVALSKDEYLQAKRPEEYKQYHALLAGLENGDIDFAELERLGKILEDEEKALHEIKAEPQKEAPKDVPIAPPPPPAVDENKAVQQPVDEKKEAAAGSPAKMGLFAVNDPVNGIFASCFDAVNLTLMRDPYTLGLHTFDKQTIIDWVKQGKNTHPITGVIFAIVKVLDTNTKEMIDFPENCNPNLAVKSIIEGAVRSGVLSYDEDDDIQLKLG